MLVVTSHKKINITKKNNNKKLTGHQDHSGSTVQKVRLVKAGASEHVHRQIHLPLLGPCVLRKHGSAVAHAPDDIGAVVAGEPAVAELVVEGLVALRGIGVQMSNDAGLGSHVADVLSFEGDVVVDLAGGLAVHLTSTWRKITHKCKLSYSK